VTAIRIDNKPRKVYWSLMQSLMLHVRRSVKLPDAWQALVAWRGHRFPVQSCEWKALNLELDGHIW